MRAMGFIMDSEKFPHLGAWIAAMRRDPIFTDDLRRTSAFMKTIGTTSDFERTKIFWRGDRIEWLLARDFHDWFLGEIRAGRVLWPE